MGEESNKDIALKNALEFFEGNELAATTYLNKYALKDKEGKYIELSPNDTIKRVMLVLANAMPEDKTIESFFDKDGKSTYKLGRPSEEFLKRFYGEDYDRHMLMSSEGQDTWFELFVQACNNFVGICPQGSILAAAGDYEKPQSISNCYVIDSPQDNVSSIMRAGEESAHIYRRRGGVGVDITHLRPKGTPVANAAKISSGAVGWMEYFSGICRVIGQDSRRGALLLSIDIKHPDALAFAEIKQDLAKITGANISIKLSDEFMRAVEKGKPFTQQWPVDSTNPEIICKVDAKELWKRICQCAWSTGEPGLLFFDEIKRNLPSECYWPTLSCNPCGEQPLPAGESCRLISMCLIKYIVNAFKKDAQFDFIMFEKDIRLAMRMMDAVVSEEQNCLHRIIAKIEEDSSKQMGTNFSTDLNLWKMCLEKGQQGRRCGLGTHGLGDCLAQLCLRYDSDKALIIIKSIYEVLRNTAYDESVEMAKEYGPFPIWDWELEKECEFFKRLPPELLQKMIKFGRRNMVILTNSPTGSISLLSQSSSGIEPTFRQFYTRRRKINHSDQPSKIDFVDQNGDKWEEFLVFEKNVARYFSSIGKKCPPNLDDVKLPEYFVSSDQIDWKQRVDIQSIITSMMDASISSTINLPKEVTVELVQNIYERAWKKKLKGTTIYRESSRTGILLSKKEEEPKQIIRAKAPDRPKKLPCEINFVSIRGSTYVVIVGLLNNAVYEVFCGEYSNQIPKKQYSGYVERKKKGEYYLCFLDDEQLEFREININEYFNNTEYASATRLISMSLSHGVPLWRVSDQLKKSSVAIGEFGAAIARVLKKYIKLEDLTNLYSDCSSCHSKNIEIKHESGCYSIICKDCNFVDSKCS